MSENATPKRTTAGLIWSFIDNISQQAINFVVGIILARILLPEEFGLLGIVTVFTAVLNTFVDGGLNDAVVNKRNASDEDYNTVFWSNIIFSLLAYSILYVLAPYIALYFNQSELINLLRLGGLTLILLALSSIQRSLLVKEINFKKISIVSLISVILSGSIAIVMALNGFGVISLISRILIGQILTVVLFWIVNTWRPKMVFSIESFKELYKYGVNIFISRFLNTIQNNLFPFLIGKLYTPTILGYFTRADSFKSILSTNISHTIQRVSFPVLSQLDGGDVVLQYNRFIITTIILTSFSMTFLYVGAETIVLVLLGEKWFLVIPYLKILAVSGLFLPLYNMNLNLLAAIRKTKVFLLIELVAKALLIPMIFLAIKLEIINFLWAIVLYSIITYLISFFCTKRYCSKKINEQLSFFLKMLIPLIISVLLIPFLDVVTNIYVKFGAIILSLILIFGLCIYVIYPRIYMDIKKNLLR